MFSTVVYVLEIIEEDGLSDQKVEVRSILRSILSFEFVFTLHLMKNILGITNKLSIALQKNNERWWMEIFIDWIDFILYQTWYSYLEHEWNICN